MIYKVFEALQNESRKGDFVDLTNKDRIDLEIDLSNLEIEQISHWMWKKFINNKIKIATLKYLIEDNSNKEKTKNITFSELKMSEYLHKNIKTSISKTIFAIRSKTFDVKEYNPCKYRD